MVRVRPIALFAVTLLALASALPACSGGGGDDDDDNTATPTVTPNPDPTPIAGSVIEVEPNDDVDDATLVASTAGTIAFHGRCSQTGDQDWFALTLSTGGFAAELTWDERDYIGEPHIANDLDLYVSDVTGELGADDGLAPGDSPANVSASMNTAGQMVLLVDCFQADSDLFYQGTVTP